MDDVDSGRAGMLPPPSDPPPGYKPGQYSDAEKPGAADRLQQCVADGGGGSGALLVQREGRLHRAGDPPAADFPDRPGLGPVFGVRGIFPGPDREAAVGTGDHGPGAGEKSLAGSGDLRGGAAAGGLAGGSDRGERASRAGPEALAVRGVSAPGI